MTEMTKQEWKKKLRNSIEHKDLITAINQGLQPGYHLALETNETGAFGEIEYSVQLLEGKHRRGPNPESGSLTNYLFAEDRNRFVTVGAEYSQAGNGKPELALVRFSFTAAFGQRAQKFAREFSALAELHEKYTTHGLSRVRILETSPTTLDVCVMTGYLPHSQDEREVIPALASEARDYLMLGRQ